ncbi:hypothetical protein [Bdellovibrio sp. HCB337]|uniref:hypothetical protein n=1 Tax=Bdellovibrio sp. HCB337 TaxID=3394358 RepID=UPI0039A5D465
MKFVKYILVLGLIVSACSKKAEDSETISDELAQNVGDMMAGVDESGGSNGTLAFRSEVSGAERILAKHAPADLRWRTVLAKVLPEARATSCYGYGFGACTSSTITRNFNSCTIGSATVTGDVDITWAGTGVTTCALNQSGNTITRDPNFTVTGPYGGAFHVAKTATIGQRITWASGTGTTKAFNFSNDGIRRWVTTPGGTTIYDYTTTTTSDITVTGTLRSNRVMNGGTLRVTNNLTSATCDISPSNVNWSSGCTCASSGSWSGTCSDGSSVSLSITSCGSGTLTIGSTSRGVSFDRCTGT